MLGKSDDASIEAATYPNSAVIGQHEDGTTSRMDYYRFQAGGNSGLLSRAGYNASNLSE